MKMNRYVWILYPIFAGLFIAISGNYLLGNSDIWDKLIKSNEDVAGQEVKINELEKKIDTLSNFNSNEAINDLKKLTTAVPPSRTVWSVLSAVNTAASESGSKIDTYKAVVGNVKEASAAGSEADQPLLIKATLSIADVARLRRFLSSISNAQPLLKVTSVDYDGLKANVNIEAAFAPWTRETVQVGSLPDYVTPLADVKSKLEGFVFGMEYIQATMPAGLVENKNPF